MSAVGNEDDAVNLFFSERCEQHLIPFHEGSFKFTHIALLGRDQAAHMRVKRAKGLLEVRGNFFMLLMRSNWISMEILSFSSDERKIHIYVCESQKGFSCFLL